MLVVMRERHPPIGQGVQLPQAREPLQSFPQADPLHVEELAHVLRNPEPPDHGDVQCVVHRAAGREHEQLVLQVPAAQDGAVVERQRASQDEVRVLPVAARDGLGELGRHGTQVQDRVACRHPVGNAAGNGGKARADSSGPPARTRRRRPGPPAE